MPLPSLHHAFSIAILPRPSAVHCSHGTRGERLANGPTSARRRQAKVSCCKETVWHPYGAHKVPELSVYALETYTTESIALTAIDHSMAEPLPDAPRRAYEAAVANRWRISMRPYPRTVQRVLGRPTGPPGRSAVRWSGYRRGRQHLLFWVVRVQVTRMLEGVQKSRPRCQKPSWRPGILKPT